jgi:hypothetical protein
LLAMEVNENANILNKRVVLKTFASELAPTGMVVNWRGKKAPAIARRGCGYFSRISARRDKRYALPR